jgi:elongation factor Ts
VSRNDLFKNLATQIASTSLFVPDIFQNLDKARLIHHIPVDSFINSPIMPHPSSASADTDALFKTVQESIVETIGKLGENITLRRVAVVADPESELQQVPKQHDRTILASAYTHGGDSTTGKIGGIAVLGLSGGAASSPALSKLSRNVARQVVGFNPTFLNESEAVVPEGTDTKEFLETNVLTHQNYMLGGGSVREVVAKTGKDEGVNCEVIDFVRWEVGEGIEKAEQDFAGEVLRAVKGN